MRKIFCAIACMAALALASCNLNYSSTKSGLKYKILSGKAKGVTAAGKPLKVGDIVKYYFRYSIPEQKDTVLRDFYGKLPVYQKIDTGIAVKMSPVEIFPLLKTGDSAVILVSVDSILKQAPMGGAPPFFKKGQHIKAVISILDVFSSDSLARADYAKEQEKETAREKGDLDNATKVLDKYITDNNIKATKTKNGVYVVVENPGDISLKADSGMQASVKYTGIVLNGKKPFDSNIDSVNANFHKDPFPVLVGAHRTIPGWEEALPYFGKGGKGKIYIPASLGYGAQQAGPDIPPYSNLVFDIEITDVTKPAASPAMGMPQGKISPEMQKQLQEQIKKQMQAKQGAKPAGH
ncbi:MAG: FKBP-type peptidyl-prolyl cis-trans isomerase [Arachidicoccus sp.]|nr:FKBP-type peptidyl-prolyl cis-trans isomerase [Arachidicoccus sp.]